MLFWEFERYLENIQKLREFIDIQKNSLLFVADPCVFRKNQFSATTFKIQFIR